MFIAVIFGYLVATLLAFCGLVSVWDVLTAGTFESVKDFSNNLFVAAAPLGLAAMVVLLVQIACMLEAFKIKAAIGTESAPKNNGKKSAFSSSKKEAAPSASGQFFRSEPQPVDAAPAKPAKKQVEEESLWEATQPPADAEKPAAAAQPQEQKPVTSEDAGLGFFRIN